MSGACNKHMDCDAGTPWPEAARRYVARLGDAIDGQAATIRNLRANTVPRCEYTGIFGRCICAAHPEHGIHRFSDSAQTPCDWPTPSGRCTAPRGHHGDHVPEPPRHQAADPSPCQVCRALITPEDRDEHATWHARHSLTHRDIERRIPPGAYS